MIKDPKTIQKGSKSIQKILQMAGMGANGNLEFGNNPDNVWYLFKQEGVAQFIIYLQASKLRK